VPEGGEGRGLSSEAKIPVFLEKKNGPEKGWSFGGKCKGSKKSLMKTMGIRKGFPIRQIVANISGWKNQAKKK